MDWDSIVQLGALAVVAVLMIAKDAKRDEFLQQYMKEMKETVDRNTASFDKLRESFDKLRESMERGKK